MGDVELRPVRAGEDNTATLTFPAVPSAVLPAAVVLSGAESGPSLRPNPGRPLRLRRPLGTPAAVVLWSSCVVSLLCLWLLLSAVVLGAVQNRAEQGRLYDTLREQLADGTAPLGPTTPGRPVALLRSARAGLNDAVVVEGTSSGQTQRGPGHRRNTALPGQQGVSVLFGRGASYGSSFGGISNLRAGDRITATTGQGEFVYLVDGVRRGGDPLPLPLAVAQGRLTLATLEGASWSNGLSANNVVYVDATLQGQGQMPGAARPAAVPPSEELMGGDSGATLLLLMWVQVLLVVGCALGWAHVRWGLWQTWIVGVPVLVAVLWSASTAAAQLLPNLL